MANDFRLLFKAIVLEPPSLDERIAVLAKWVTHQRQVKSPASLRLPHMRELVDENALFAQVFAGEIFRPQVRMRVEMDVSRRRHSDVAWLEGPPAAAKHPDPRIVDRITEHAAGELNLS